MKNTFIILLVFLATLFPAGIVSAVDFTTPGQYEWVVPSGVTKIQVKLWGAGGAGGSGKKIDNSHRAGQGGGAGGYLDHVMTVNPGDRYTVKVGAGGIAVPGKTTAAGGTGSEFFLASDRSRVIGAAGGAGGVTYVWDEDYAGENGSPSPFGGIGGTRTTPATGGVGYIGTVESSQRGRSGAVIQGDDRGNPSATSGGGAPFGGAGGSRGRLGPDGSGHCNTSSPAPRGIFGLPWWASPPPAVIIDAILSDGTNCNDPSLRAQHGTGPGGGGGGSDTGLGANGANGKVSITLLPPDNPSGGGGTPPVVPGNPSDGGNSPVVTLPPPVVRSSSGGYNQATVKLVSQTMPIPQTLASQTISLTQVPYTGLSETLSWMGVVLLTIILAGFGNAFLKRLKRA